MARMKDKLITENDWSTELHDAVEYDLEDQRKNHKEAMGIYYKELDANIKRLETLDRRLGYAQKGIQYLIIGFSGLGFGYMLGQVLIYVLGL